MDKHRALVSSIASTVRSFYAAKEPYRIFHGSTNSTRPSLTSNRVVDISALRNVLSVDTARKTALVEPNVPMDALVSHTLKHGLVPPVVMEFPGITAGGGFAGSAGESSSFRHGWFDDTVRSVEIVLPDGEVVTAQNPALAPAAPPEKDSSSSSSTYADLYRGAAGAVGTLGVTTMLELNLVPAKKFVRTRYQRTRSVAEAIRLVKAATADASNDYVDGILYSKDHGVVITGQMTDDKPGAAPVQTFSRARDPWFYLHVASRTQAHDTAEDFVPLAEYLFRYDRAGFWVARAGWRYFKLVPFTAATRWFLDDFIHTRMLYRALHGSGESARFIVQDVAMPFATTERLVDYTAQELGIWPLWLCPLKRRAPPTFHPYTTTPRPDKATGKNFENEEQQQGEEEEMMLNVGVWGWGPAKHDDFVKANRALEAKVRELGGMKWLYAHTYYDEPEFWDMYGGREWYDALRNKYKADEAGLPSVYDKVKVDLDKIKAQRSGLKGVRPFGGIYGIWKSIRSKDYLLHRNAEWKWKGE